MVKKYKKQQIPIAKYILERCISYNKTAIRYELLQNDKTTNIHCMVPNKQSDKETLQDYIVTKTLNINCMVPETIPRNQLHFQNPLLGPHGFPPEKLWGPCNYLFEMCTI